MAQINIVTTAVEQHKVLEAIRKLQGQTVAVATIAREAGLSANRTRYVVTDLLDAKKIKREPTKAFNKHYVRYKYEVVE